MRYWIRTTYSKEPSSWNVVGNGLLEGFTENEIEVCNEPCEVEIWWGDPSKWNWSGESKLQVGIAVSENRSLLYSAKKAIIENINKANLLLCPSYESMQAYLEAPFSIPVQKIKFGVSKYELEYVERDFFSREFSFLLLGAVQPRKGSWLVPEAFVKAFPDNKDVSLTIATGGAIHGSGMFGKLEAEYGNDKRITFIEHRIQNKMLLYSHKNHVLVHPHLAEGFGLCIPEAMYTGMPCLVSRCSAPLEFFTNDFGWWIEMSDDYVPVKQTLPNTNGFWRIPCIESLSNLMLYTYNNRNECYLKGINASKHGQSMTWTEAVKTIIMEVQKCYCQL